MGYANWNNVGLLFDISGTWILASALVFQSDESLLAKASTDWDWNQAVAHDLCLQRADAVIGAIFLTIGFALQLQQTQFAPNPNWMVAVIAGGVVILVAYFVWLRQTHARRRMKRLTELDTEKLAAMERATAAPKNTKSE